MILSLSSPSPSPSPSSGSCCCRRLFTTTTAAAAAVVLLSSFLCHHPSLFEATAFQSVTTSHHNHHRHNNKRRHNHYFNWQIITTADGDNKEEAAPRRRLLLLPSASPLYAAKKKKNRADDPNIPIDHDEDDHDVNTEEKEEAIASIILPSTTAARKKLLAKRKQLEEDGASISNSSSKTSIKNEYQQSKKIKRFDDYYEYYTPTSSSSSSTAAQDSNSDDNDDDHNSYLIDLKKKIDQKIMRNNWYRTGQRRPRVNDHTKLQHHHQHSSSSSSSSSQSISSSSSSSSSKVITPGQVVPEVHVQHETDSMQSLLGYNHFEGEWSDRNSTTYHVVIVFGKGLINDQISIEYATRIRTLVKMLKEEDTFQPKLICFTGGNKNSGSSSGSSAAAAAAAAAGGSVVEENSISDASAGYVYFRHLCASQGIHLDNNNNNNNNNSQQQTNIWVDKRNGNERETMERVASELWKKYIKTWLKDRPLTERLNQHYGVGWQILERRVDIHFTLISTEYHLCNLNDVHHRSPGKSFLQPLVSLRGLVGSDRWVMNKDELEAMDPSYSSSVHVSGGSSSSSRSRTALSSSSSSSENGSRARFAGIENSVDTSWSFQYATFPFLHGKEDSIVFLGKCYLLGEELTPLLVNLKGVVEQVRELFSV